MRKLLLLIAAILAFSGARGAARGPGAIASQRLSFGKILSILMAPRWMRIPLMVRAMMGGRRQPSKR